MIYKITYGFGGQGQGWAETHAQQQATTNPTLLLAMHTDLAQKRANFLGSPFALTHIRIAKFLDENTFLRARGSLLSKQPFTSQNPQLTGGAEPADVAIIVRGVPNVGNPALASYAGAANQTFLGAPPDLAVNDGGVVNQGLAGLGAALASWRQAMIAANMGWLAVTRTDDVPIGAIANTADGRLMITLTRPYLAGPAVNQPTTVRVRGINGGRTPIPGQLIGRFTSTIVFQTNAVIGFSVDQIGGFMRVYQPIPQFLAYGGMLTEGLVGEHKRGRPFGTPPGRRRRVVRG